MLYPVLLFDLFGTLVHFTSRVPSVQIAGETRRSTMHWLEDTVSRELPHVSFSDFLLAIGTVTSEIVTGRPPDYLEVSSQERFARALARLNAPESGRAGLAERLSLAHMAHLAGQTVMPPEHGELLRELGRDRVLGLLSNFDHGPTAHAILRREGIEDLFRVVLISEEFGRRKPHPAIFTKALKELGAAASEVLYIGDTFEDDVAGARAAGIEAAWIDAKGAGISAGSNAPAHVLCRLTDLAPLLGDGRPPA